MMPSVVVVVVSIFSFVSFSFASCPFHVEPYRVANVASQPEVATALTALQSRINAAMPVFNRSLGATALTVSVSYYDDTIFFAGVGVRRYDTPTLQAPDQNTIFRIGSISKLFTSLLVLVAVDQGLIGSLDEPVSRFVPLDVLPPYGFTSIQAGNITWQQLLSHTSGLFREAPCAASAGCRLPTNAILARLASRRLQTLPSTRAMYSNFGFALLGRIVGEFVFGSTFETALTNAVLKPLGLARTGANVTAWIAGAYGLNDALSYFPGTLTVNPAIAAELGWAAPAGDLFSTPADLNALAHELVEGYFGRGKLLKRTSLYRQSMLPQYIDNSARSGFASPYEIALIDSYQVERKGGNVGGYSALIAVVPALGVSMSLTINSGFDELGAPGLHFLETIVDAFSAMYIRLEPSRVFPTPPASFRDYAGTYTAFQAGVNTGITATLGKSGANPTQLSFAVTISPMALALRWVMGETFTLHLTNNGTDVNPSTVECLQVQALSTEEAQVEFQRDPMTNKVTQFTVPGLFFDGIFVKN
jgi:CubicO group peptidase (beta-lactamase class C family)